MPSVRGHNEGSIYQRRTGQWVAAVTMRSGRRATRWSKSRDEAKADLAELLRLRDAGARDTGRIRLGTFLERWVTYEIGYLGPATRRKHGSIVRTHLVPALGHHRLSELSPGDVERAIGAMATGPQTKRHVRATLRRALADAQRAGVVSRNVAGLARPSKLAHRERTILDADQARTLIESTRDTRNGPLWTILVTTGLRISEALGLIWSDVDFGGNDADLGQRRDREGRDARQGPALTVRNALARENGEWVRRPPKTHKGRRTIPLTPLGVEALRTRREHQREDRDGIESMGLVFTTSAGHPIHATNLLPPLRADLAAAGLPKVGLHDLRHSAATILFASGLPIEAIADILGHSTVRVTQDLYRHRVPEFSRLAAEKMQEALG